MEIPQRPSRDERLLHHWERILEDSQRSVETAKNNIEYLSKLIVNKTVEVDDGENTDHQIGFEF